ncbi:hypothetical protein [Pseudonocardia sp.]|uniref:hypothetical protein n=1 Tax=Pseudonocardia sp. TaxID=60912 RepID=UPI002604DE4E|nr:hypothetical protein [Pseudonocardia sp.]
MSSDGRLDSERFTRGMFAIPLIAGIGLTVALGMRGAGIIPLIATFVLGTVAAFFLLLVSIRIRVDGAQRRVGGNILRIDRSMTRAWDLLKLVEKITHTTSWKTGLVDRDRLIPGLLWRSVLTATSLAAAEIDITRAASHDSLRELVDAKRRDLDQAVSSLGEIELRLRQVLNAAEQLDQRDRDRAHAAEKAREELELRRRLSSSETPAQSVADDTSEAFSIQAQAEALNELLAESDKIANGMRGYS